MNQNNVEKLDEAQKDIRYLLDQGYRKDDALRFVADHYSLKANDRKLLKMQTFSEGICNDTQSKLCDPSFMKGKHIVIDGFNVIITIEAGMNGKVFMCQDGVCRDNSFAFSSYQIREKTKKIIDLITEFLTHHEPEKVHWVFDTQVSGSGSLAKYTMDSLMQAGLDGEYTTSPAADHQISKLNLLTATSDPELISQLNKVIDLPRAIIEAKKK